MMYVMAVGIMAVCMTGLSLGVIMGKHGLKEPCGLPSKHDKHGRCANCTCDDPRKACPNEAGRHA